MHAGHIGCNFAWPMRRSFRGLLVIAPVLGVSLAASASDRGARDSSSTDPIVIESADTTTRVQMQNVDYYVGPRLPLRIRRLGGTMRSRAGGVVLFDDKRSFIITVQSAEIGLTAADLGVLLNTYVFGYKGSPLSRLRISFSGTELIQKGVLHKVAALPFEMRATVSVTPEGAIRIHPTRTEILGLHVDALMRGLDLPLEKLLDLSKAKGARVKGNDLYLDPVAIMPPPEIEGRVTAVRIEAAQMVMTFGPSTTANSLPIPDSTVKNYMYYRGGTLRFGKLIMLDADMLITELDPADSFRFDLDRYQSQLVAGYSKTLVSGGLEVWMRDADKLGNN